MLTNKSLLLLDELGGSIDNALARKLLGALICFLCSGGETHIEANELLAHTNDKFRMPLTIAVTHLSDVATSSLTK
jgi:hypothetical protein